MKKLFKSILAILLLSALTLNLYADEKVNDEALKKEIPLKFEKDKAYVYVVYPQGEEVAYNTGKEKVRWGYEIFYGRYTAGILVSGGGWSFKDLSIKKTSTQEIKRGRIYGAVKYNGEWRACVIETVN